MLPIELIEKIKACAKCASKKDCKGPVVGHGNTKSPLVVLGEGPGFVEDCTGIPFAGLPELLSSQCALCAHIQTCLSWFLVKEKSPWGHKACPGFKLIQTDSNDKLLELSGILTAGQVLNNALRDLDIDRDDIYIMNVVACRPTTYSENKWSNREPSDAELLNCIPYMVEQLRHIQPKAICLCGWTATRVLVYKAPKFSSILGESMDQLTVSLASRPLAVVNYHPSYVLRAETGDNYHQLYEAFRNNLEKAKLLAYG